MEFYDEKIKALAIEIYELDAEVYKKLGSSLGRVFGGEKDICIRNIMEDLHSRQNSSRIRSELALKATWQEQYLIMIQGMISWSDTTT